MLTIGAYIHYARRPWSWGRYGLVMLLFAMGLMCKPMLVTLPLVLLLLDYWPLQRVEPLKLSGLVLEKLPLLALSAASCVATVLAQNRVLQSTELLSLPLRFANALVTCIVYLGQTVYPAGLTVFYPFPLNGLPPWEVVLGGMLLAGLSAFALGQRRTQPWILVGWLWYLVMLLPVVGIIQVGDQAHADRYTYLPQIGIYVAVTWLVAEWGAKRQAGRTAIGGLMAAVVGVLMVCAGKQAAYWENGETLWTHALACTTDNYVAHFNLGNVLRQEGKMDEAIPHYQKAVLIRPDYAQAHNNLGKALLLKGKVDEAISHFQNALQIRPDYPETRVNLGEALFQKGKVDEAIVQYQIALQINPGYADGQFDLGNALLQKGRMDEAISHYQKALEIKPDFAEAHINLGNILLQKGEMDEAITHFKKAVQIRPNYAQAHNNLGNILMQKGEVDEAIAHFQKAVQIRPDYAQAHNNLGKAFLQKGNMTEAIAHFQQVLQLEPNNPQVQSNLAWLLATCPEASLRDGKKAVELAERANQLTSGGNPFILCSLAAAYAEAGRFSEAVETAQRALQLAEAQSDTRLAGALQVEMELYQAGKPFHSPEQTH
jgi:tetratricopeptide (TPR) repeat protein